MTKTVHFWRGLIGNSSQFNDYQEEITRLLCGELHGLHLEKLSMSGKEDIYSIRTNKKGRILFTTFEGNLCLLEVLENHEYDKSRFLKSGVLRRHLESKEGVDTPAPLLFEEAEVIEDLNPFSQEELNTLSFQALERFQSQFIRLSDEQNEAINASLPLLAFGPAGSGKTCVAMSMLQDFLNKQGEQDTSPPILYISQSQALVQNMSVMWTSSHASDKVQFKTYQQLLEEVLNQNISAENNEPLFDSWHKGYLSQKVAQSKAQVNTQHVPSDLPYWQEFRIRSGFSQQEYLSLGQRQSNLTKEERVIVDKTYRAFLAYLKNNQLISLELHRINSKDTIKYPLIVVDEAQDLSYAQLGNLFSLSQQGHIVYFLGDHQILFDGKSRLPFLRHLFYQQDLKAREVALSLTYRCSELVVDLSNELINLKYAVTGGTADKKEKTRLTVARETQGLGQLTWQSCQKTHNSSLLNETQNNVNIAIIALPEHKEEARQLFNTPLVFTPEEIKGLEYPTIVAYRLFDAPEAKEASTCLSHQKSPQKIKTNRAKSGTGDERLLPYFNQLLTAVTRAQSRLILVQDYTHGTRYLTTPIKTLITASQKKTDDKKQDLSHIEPSSAKSSLEDWQKEKIRQEQLGNTTQAQEISTLLLKKDQEIEEPKRISTNTLIKNKSNATQKKGKQKRIRKIPAKIITTPIQDLLNDFSEEHLLSVLQSAESSTLLQKKVVYKEQTMSLLDVLFTAGNCLNTMAFLKKNPTTILGFFNRQNTDKTVSGLSLLVNHKYGQKAVELFCKHITNFSEKINPTTIDTLFKSKGSLQWLFHRNRNEAINLANTLSRKRTRLIPSHALCDVEDTQKETSLFHSMTKNLVGHKLLKKFLEYDNSLAKKITIEALCHNLKPENCSALYMLCSLPSGRDILKLLLKINPSLAKSITFQALLNTPSEVHPSAFYWLCPYEEGREILKTLLNGNESLAASITTQALLKSDPEDNTSALYWLCVSPDGRDILTTLFNSNETLKTSIPPTALLARYSQDNSSAFYWLCQSSESCKILITILNSNPSLAASISAQELSSRHSDKKNSAFYWLCTHREGRHILRVLLKGDDSLAASLSIDTLLNLHAKDNISAFYLLCRYTNDRDILKTLLNNNQSRALSITPNALLSKDYYDNTSALYWLCYDCKESDILKRLLNSNELLATSITAEALLSISSDDIASPLYWLCQTHRGLDILHFILEKNPHLSKEIPSKYWHVEFNRHEDNPASLYQKMTKTEQGLTILKNFFPSLLNNKEPIIANISLSQLTSFFAAKQNTNATKATPFTKMTY